MKISDLIRQLSQLERVYPEAEIYVYGGSSEDELYKADGIGKVDPIYKGSEFAFYIKEGEHHNFK